jgi:hypothetical protein
MHPPETRKAALPGGPDRKEIFNSNEPITQTTPQIQAFRLVSKFGFAFETAVTISQLAWGIAR